MKIFFFLLGLSLAADTLTDNLSATSAGTEIANGSTWLAAKFYTGSSAVTVTAVTLPLANTSAGAATLAIYTESNLHPGTLVGTLTSPSSYSTSLAATTFTSTTGITLSAGTTYYLVLQASSGTFAWSWTASNTGSGSGFQPVWGFTNDAGATWSTNLGYPFQALITTGSASSGCTYTLGSGSVTAPAGGVSTSVSVTAASGCSWSASSNASSWLNITSGFSGTGSGIVSFTVAANSSTASRTGTLTIGGQTYTVTQEAATPTCSSSLTSSSLAVTSLATAGTVGVNTTLTTCTWTVTSNATWITITSANSGTGSGTVAFSIAANTGSSTRTGTITLSGLTFTVTQSAPGSTVSGLTFIPVTPCRLVDTRLNATSTGGTSLAALETRVFAFLSYGCSIPANVAAYALNVTAVPKGQLGYITMFPTGQTQPVVSTLNSLDGRVKANAAIVPAGTNGSVSLYTTDATDAVIDLTGYFVSSGGLAYYPVTPCRVADTRNATGSLGGPILSPLTERSFPVTASACGIPSSAQAYALNITVVPTAALGYLTAWPTGQTRPLASTLNAVTGAVTANAAILSVGTAGAVSLFATEQTHAIIDINGYFAPAAVRGQYFYPVNPCRVVDTRLAGGTLGGPNMAALETRSYPVPSSPCNVPATAGAYALNATVVPSASLGYLTLWQAGVSQPVVSTLNAVDAAITSNLAIVPTGSAGAISAFVSGATPLILDISGYFSTSANQ